MQSFQKIFAATNWARLGNNLFECNPIWRFNFSCLHFLCMIFWTYITHQLDYWIIHLIIWWHRSKAVTTFVNLMSSRGVFEMYVHLTCSKNYIWINVNTRKGCIFQFFCRDCMQIAYNFFATKLFFPGATKFVLLSAPFFS